MRHRIDVGRRLNSGRHHSARNNGKPKQPRRDCHPQRRGSRLAPLPRHRLSGIYLTPSIMSKGSAKQRRRGSIDVVDAKQAVDLATAQSYSENVFLFVPNLIGTSSFSLCSACGLTFILLRLLSYPSSRIGLALHEFPPQILYACVLYFVFAGCCGWTRCQSFGPDFEIWSSIGHGH